jgi:hypothetical protein
MARKSIHRPSPGCPEASCVALAFFELPEHALGLSWAFPCAYVCVWLALDFPEGALGLHGTS